MNISRESGDQKYRRGLVMGLTLAEVMLLVLFALLFVLAWLAQREDEDTVLGRAVRPLLPESVVAGPADDLLQYLDAVVRLGRDAVAAVAPEESLSPSSADDDRVAERAVDLLSLGMQAESVLGPNNSGMSPNEAATEALQAAASEYSDVRESQGHGSARIWLEWLVRNQPRGDGGNGLVYPSCVPSDNGTTQYIFDVTLGSDGLIVKDNALSQMERWSREAAGVEFDGVVSQTTFISMTQLLFDWSVQSQCRFFVRVFDATAPFEKTLYKDELQTVEDHFYKFLADEIVN